MRVGEAVEDLFIHAATAQERRTHCGLPQSLCLAASSLRPLRRERYVARLPHALLHSANAYLCTAKKSLQDKPLSAHLLGVLLLEEILRGHIPPHPIFNVVFSSPVHWCKISVIQLRCFGDKISLPMLSREHEGQDSKCFLLVKDLFHQPYY